MKEANIKDQIIRWHKWLLGLILLLGALLRVAGYLDTDRFPRDERVYLSAAGRIRENQSCEMVYVRPLLPPYAAGRIARLLSLNVALTFRLLNLTASVLLIWVGYGIARQCFEEILPALLCALFFALHPYLLKISMTVLREPFYWLFFALAVYLGLRLLKQLNCKIFMLSGGVTALAILSRIEGVELLLIPGLVLLNALRLEGWKKQPWKLWLLRGACWCGGFAAVFLLFAFLAARYTRYFWYPLYWRI